MITTVVIKAMVYLKGKNAKNSGRERNTVLPDGVHNLSVNDTYMDAQEVMHMTDYSKLQPFTPAFPWVTRTGTAARATAYRTKKYFWRTMPEGST